MSNLVVCPKCEQLNRVNLSAGGTKMPVCGKCQSPLDGQTKIQELSVHGLQKLVRQADLSIVVDFWAPWCGPCRGFAPTFASASVRHAGKILFAKVNTEAFPDAGQLFQIRGIPTLAIFRSGREVARTSGALPAAQLDAFVQPWFDAAGAKSARNP